MAHTRNVHFNTQGHALVLTVGVLLCLLFPGPLFAADGKDAESLISSTCSTCHKFQGEGESRFNLKAPDLMWGGQQVSAGLAD
ncbi:MAG: hypothetical protein H0X47_11290 [Nitrospirales bacterium]|nr:hypothetical protein [Nitrospirales bacterium]